ncbi:MAG: TonB-dependent receptor plug domain-containing protein [Bacteroidales bacterium]|nr:TonB-dependent receptor plug domain-containing protein [Bacteroidales bacterium]
MFALVLLPAVEAEAQHQGGVLQGRVTQVGTNGPVEYATVAVTRLGDTLAKPQGALTNAQGYYKVERLPVGVRLAVLFQCSGMVGHRDTIVIGSGVRKLDCQLQPSSTQLNTVTVTQNRLGQRGVTKIGEGELEVSTGPNEGVESLVKTLPGVTSNNEMSSQYSVRGGSFDENLVYINGVEVYRPSLIRSGQQEGMSIVNADMVQNILFSPGGFEPLYGDKLSSVLDITYKRPLTNHYRLSASLLGGSASAQGFVPIGKTQSLTYLAGLRLHNNAYLFRKLDTKGTYNTRYADFQTVLTYTINPKTSLSLLAIASSNRYGLIPLDQTTKFGNFMETLTLRVYFDGQEIDRYRTGLAALTLDYQPTDNLRLQWVNSWQRMKESELYDIQSQYWLYELGVGEVSGETEAFDRGVGTFLEHARNYLDTRVYSSEAKATAYRKNGSLNAGVRFQIDQIDDRVREWKWVDSAGFAMPTQYPTPGDENNVPYNPMLQFYCNSANSILTTRLQGYAQRDLSFRTEEGAVWTLIAGARAHYYSMQIESDGGSNRQLLFSPRLIATLKPAWQRDMLWRLAAGLYNQPPFYREMRLADATLYPNAKAQQSLQAVASCDWVFKLLDKPCKLTTDVYYKYLYHLVPYTIDNLRVRYDASREATGYAAGVGLRLNAQLVPDLESWASLSLMNSMYDIVGDEYGYIATPTNQCVAFKLFFQDYLPQAPWWCMSMHLIAASGLPFTYPQQTDFSRDYYLPAYFRVDWGNTLRLHSIQRLADAKVFRTVDDIQLSVEVFNLFNYKNVVSYLWVSDYDNIYYGVPNYLTARQLNLKLTITF